MNPKSGILMNQPVIKSIFTSFFLMIAAPIFLSAASYPSNYDIVYHRISVTVDPGTSGAISNGSVTTYFKTRINNFTIIAFDLDQAMVVSSVKYHGSTVPNTHTSNVITITLPNIAVAGTLDSLTINYSGTPVAPATSIPSGYNYVSGSIYTLGEAFRGNTWWPCRDSLVDKIDSVDIIITTPSAYRAGSNGVVTETIVGPNRICTWKTRHPIATYMINFAAGDYVNYQFNATSLTHTVPVLNYLHSADNNATYKGYLNMLQNVMPAYATVLNTDYPFYDEKYGTAECGSGWGALEVQSMTFIDRTSYSGGYTLAHELAHQWFGDKLTTGDWHHIWLNEGFAQYFQQIIYPELLLSTGTQSSQRVNLKGSVNSSSTTYVSDISNADKIFFGTSSSQPYEKGAMTISMLRAWLGDANFFTALNNYLNAPGLAYNYTYVDSLKKYMQAQTPNDLTNFFNDWVFQKGTVTYVVKYQYATNGIYIQLTSQAQTGAGAGYFDTPVPIQIKNGSGLDTTVVLIDRGGVVYNSVTGHTYNSSTYYFHLSATPNVTPIFDPKSNILATASISSSATLSTLITLPIQDINLSVTGSERNAKINWTITADEPLESVEIEKSKDGVNFQAITKTATVEISPNKYTGIFNEDQAGEGTLFYRLKVNKKNGSFNYSAIKILNLATTGTQLNIAPNPVQNYCTIRIPLSYINQSQQMSLLIYNSAGLLVQEKRIAANTNSVSVSCKLFPAGRYNAVLINEKQQQLQTQFIKQ
jgi:aminopeptidase N